MKDFAVRHEEVEAKLKEIGLLLKEAVSIPGYGFALVIFSLKGPEMSYASNVKREDIIRAMHEFIARLKDDVEMVQAEQAIADLAPKEKLFQDLVRFVREFVRDDLSYDHMQLNADKLLERWNDLNERKTQLSEPTWQNAETMEGQIWTLDAWKVLRRRGDDIFNVYYNGELRAFGSSNPIDAMRYVRLEIEKQK